MSRKKTGTRGKWLRIFAVMLIVLAAAVAAGRLFVADPEQEMTGYTVTVGNIETKKSFSAVLSVEDSETITNTEGVTTIKELYVTSGQEVRKGDQILTLGTGKTYVASINGTVNEIRFKKGDFVWPNINLAQVCDLEHLEVQLQVDEYDVKKVEVGQKCTVCIVPLSLEYETVITHVNRMSASSGRVAYYPVTAQLTVPEYVLPGMTVSVQIADESAENVLTLPAAALSFTEDGEPYVLVRKQTEYEQVPVTVGLSDGMTVEIRSGLSEGDLVFAPALAGADTETTMLTRILRSIFGTRTVINEEAAERGSRGGRNGSAQNMPENQPGMGPEGEGVPEIRQGNRDGQAALPENEAEQTAMAAEKQIPTDSAEDSEDRETSKQAELKQADGDSKAPGQSEDGQTGPDSENMEHAQSDREAANRGSLRQTEPEQADGEMETRKRPERRQSDIGAAGDGEERTQRGTRDGTSSSGSERETRTNSSGMTEGEEQTK
ncbi:MAG: efflux RND transporter periplasmic adaptor subunit [Clostridia bacterium]|nr:efflux RND transporter periplasmic adaptor subunit [Clostridia bacterium]